MKAMKLDLPYLMTDTDRHGNRRLFVRRSGRKIRLRQAPGTTEFARAYSEALEALDGPAPEGRHTAARGSLGWLASCYWASNEFRGLAPRSQAERRRIIEACLQEPRKPGSKDLMRDCPIRSLTAKHVKMLRDRKTGLPGAANTRRKYLSAMFGWAVEADHMESNPARDARKIKYATDGFHTWTLEEVAQFEAKHPVGTKARLALGLLLFLGTRRGDVVKLGRQHETADGNIRMVPRKTRHRRLTASEKPILPILRGIIDASPTGAMTYLETAYRRPFTDAGFGGRMRKWCDAAGLPHCTAHGLRKAGATIAANNGATDRQLMALYDWETASQATTYTRQADKKRMAGEAAKLIANNSCPTFTAPPEKKAINQ